MSESPGPVQSQGYMPGPYETGIDTCQGDSIPIGCMSLPDPGACLEALSTGASLGMAALRINSYHPGTESQDILVVP